VSAHGFNKFQGENQQAFSNSGGFGSYFYLLETSDSRKRLIAFFNELKEKALQCQ